MSANFAERLAELPGYLGGHLLLSLSALLIGILISLPLGIWAARSERFGGTIVNVAALIQTIPSMALLALMVPILGGTIGFGPAFVALTLYSILPVLRNTVTGLQEVDPAMVEAARGVGMTDRQRLWQVELPLAAPVIIAGVRTATVWVVGIATLSTPVGAESLGNYIFSGLQTRNWLSVIFGCVFAALLAIILDQLVRLLEKSAQDRDRRLAGLAGIGLAVVFAGGIGPVVVDTLARSTALPLVPQASISSEEAAGPPGPQGLQGQTVRIGTKTFTEQFILADVIAKRLEADGAIVESLQNLGSTIVFDALRNNTVDVYVDYTGTIWATIMGREDPVERTAMFIEMAEYLRKEHGILTVGRLGFENAYGFAMRRDRAAELGIRSIADLARHAGNLVIGGDPEFFARNEWIRVRDAYGLSGFRTRSMDSTFMYGAVRDGNVDVITAYTTDGRISAFDLVILSDERQAFPPYDAILLLSPDGAQKPGLIKSLSPLLYQIDDTLMREANKQVDIDSRTPKQAADFLYDKFSQQTE